MVNITAGMTAVKAALDITKIILDKVNTPNIDVNGVRASVQEMLIHVVNAQTALGEALVENAELRQQIANRDVLKALENDLEYTKDGGFYIRKSDGAFCCPACWGDKQKVVPMTPIANGYYTCPLHKSSYQTKDAKAEQQRLIKERDRNQRVRGHTPWS